MHFIHRSVHTFSISLLINRQHYSIGESIGLPRVTVSKQIFGFYAIFLEYALQVRTKMSTEPDELTINLGQMLHSHFLLSQSFPWLQTRADS